MMRLQENCKWEVLVITLIIPHSVHILYAELHLRKKRTGAGQILPLRFFVLFSLTIISHLEHAV